LLFSAANLAAAIELFQLEEGENMEVEEDVLIVPTLAQLAAARAKVELVLKESDDKYAGRRYISDKSTAEGKCF
jgi:hypothetical protein